MDQVRADHCDCTVIPEGWCCGKPTCHRTLIANARLKQFGRDLDKAVEEMRREVERS